MTCVSKGPTQYIPTAEIGVQHRARCEHDDLLSKTRRYTPLGVMHVGPPQSCQKEEPVTWALQLNAHFYCA